ncbi:MAG TPA: methyltransferase domain-containing protein [Verrucomicrobiota bacterium]|nr:hypothetical protein [Verrucomicrobiales bacterium]HRI14616.1 methyltransferase domain-containing protein [Verrucomicrobiota bacterium]
MPPSTSAPAIAVAGSDTATPLNLEKRLALIARHFDLRGKRLIDCGCGAGEYVVALGERGAEAVGVEYMAEKVAQFVAAHPDDSRVSAGDIENLPYADGTFDLALLNEVLEHVPNDAQALVEVRRVLKPGGSVIVFSPNRLYPFETHGVHLRRPRRRIAHYVPFIPYLPLPLGRAFLEYWARNYWPGQLRRLVTQAQFRVRYHGFIWQTFENISGNQPRLIGAARPVLRRVAMLAECVPGLRAFGTSQAIIAQRV